ncbi:hypothetical protein BaRGS_00010555 [Batillaria attramentaria]|uniref:Uncharacterized protein n=1 Tax=Batillaria attramentaria TaxID=370345 RepID=A0ABD0LG16_9CAEN
MPRVANIHVMCEIACTRRQPWNQCIINQVSLDLTPKAARSVHTLCPHWTEISPSPTLALAVRSAVLAQDCSRQCVPWAMLSGFQAHSD